MHALLPRNVGRRAFTVLPGLAEREEVRRQRSAHSATCWCRAAARSSSWDGDGRRRRRWGRRSAVETLGRRSAVETTLMICVEIDLGC